MLCFYSYFTLQFLYWVFYRSVPTIPGCTDQANCSMELLVCKILHKNYAAQVLNLWHGIIVFSKERFWTRSEFSVHSIDIELTKLIDGVK
eukprot:snap_masked-scaffold_8-processed-gene-12.22-mRNA-1 protein AED:1.00 eAED:1.00 QI:0/0/0/0/1/1/2/0/89